MACDDQLTARFRDALKGIAGIEEKRMLGGMCFMLNGNMLGGADREKHSNKGRFMLRVGKQNEAAALARPGSRIMEQGGRRMGGLIFVDEQFCNKEALRNWIELAIVFVGKLPPK